MLCYFLYYLETRHCLADPLGKCSYVLVVIWSFCSACRKYRSQKASNVFADLDEEAVTGMDVDGMVFDPNHFKAVREASLSWEF